MQPEVTHWTTWSSTRGYPLNSSEEEEFILQLQAADYSNDTHQDDVITARNHISLLMTLMRDGGGVNTFRDLAPNINPHRLAEEYDMLRKKLENAKAAWGRIVTNPNSYPENAEEAYKVLPHLINMLSNTCELERHTLVAELAHQVDKYTTKINQIEEAPTTRIDVHTGKPVCYSLVKSATPLWDNNFFLPSRVGQLTATRLAFLLGETKIDQ